ncbi:C40 family peptidase [Pseudoclavibacter soli]|uniref:C40 family peptidase n=1 Tax=Pseudoclavibacter soli TaxID=452623 RepID=UPI00040D285F|nr:C40 family peptidase [Pseudoclavibacter soli]
MSEKTNGTTRKRPPESAKPASQPANMPDIGAVRGLPKSDKSLTPTDSLARRPSTNIDRGLGQATSKHDGQAIRRGSAPSFTGTSQDSSSETGLTGTETKALPHAEGSGQNRTRTSAPSGLDNLKKEAVKKAAKAAIPGGAAIDKAPVLGKLLDKAAGKVAKGINGKKILILALVPLLLFFGPIFGVAMLIPSLGQSTTSKTSDSVTSSVAEDDVDTDTQDDIASCATNGQSTKTEDSNDECAEVTVDASNASSSDSGEEVATGTRAEIVEYAKSLLGTPYLYGGSSPEEGGMDCSGYMVYVFKHFNISLPRTAEEMRDSGRSISQSELQPGDLVVWTDHGHVAMYVGNNQIVEEPRPGKSAQLVDIRDADVTIFRNVID